MEQAISSLLHRQNTMKMNYLKITTIVVLLSVFVSCGDAEEIDQEKPVIDMSESEAFPVACDTLYFGESFTLKALFSDNVELGSFSLDIHNNFDHHSHSTEVTECNLAETKEPVNPYVLIQDFEIPESSKTYQTSLEVSLPSSNDDGEYDEGDYHFHISLVDKTGWSIQVGVGVKMLHR